MTYHGSTVLQLIAYRPDLDLDPVACWNAAAGDCHPLPASLGPGLTTEDPAFRPEDLRVALLDGRPVGFALAKRLREDNPALAKFAQMGWIALMAVLPAFQRRGVGTALLSDVETYLARDGARVIRLGEGFHHALAGVPVALSGALPFFASRGYTSDQAVWDVRGNPLAVEPPRFGQGTTARPISASEVEALLAFLQATFPGRWHRDTALDLQRGEPIGHQVGLFVDGKLSGFARIHPPGSPGARRWAGFNPAIGALGPIGIAKTARGQGLGLGLLQAGLAHLAALGAQDAVIDWTTLLDFYARVGFHPWLHYQQARKELV